MKQPVTYTRLSADEREVISRSLAQGLTYGEVGRSLGRETSTISRELSHLRYNPSSYRATFAEEIAKKRKNHRTKIRSKLSVRRPLAPKVITS